MPDLLIRLKRHADGSASLTCTRRDGTTTWQRQNGTRARFFPPHDLTHFAVETTLGFDRGFFGLIAEGWDIRDFAAPWPRGPLPDEALEVELIVGFLDAERAMDAPLSVEEFQAHATRFVEAARTRKPGARVPTPRALDVQALEDVRALLHTLLAAWRSLTPPDSLSLDFDRALVRG